MPKSKLKPKPKMVRGAYQFPEQEMDRLDEIAGDLGVSRAQVLRSAFRIYDWLLELTDEGKEILTRDGDGRLEQHHHPEAVPKKKPGA